MNTCPIKRSANHYIFEDEFKLSNVTDNGDAETSISNSFAYQDSCYSHMEGVETRKKSRTLPNAPMKYKNIPLENGPHIKARVPKRTFSSKEEFLYFHNNIKIKQKTEVIRGINQDV